MIDDRQCTDKWNKILQLMHFNQYLHNFHYILKTENVYNP